MEKQPISLDVTRYLRLTMAFLLFLQSIASTVGHASDLSAHEDTPPPHTTFQIEMEDVHNDNLSLSVQENTAAQTLTATEGIEVIDDPHHRKGMEKCFHFCDVCSRNTWRALHPVFGWLSFTFNGASTVTAFMGLLDEERAEYWNGASLIFNGFSTVMGWMKAIAARHVEAHLAKETGLSVDKFHDEMGQTGPSQTKTAPTLDDATSNDAGTIGTDPTPEPTDESWMSLKPWARCLLSSLSNVSYVTWTIGKPVFEVLSVILPIVAGTLGVAATQVNGKKTRYHIQISKIIIDGCATLCAALLIYAIARLETLARQITQQQKAAAKRDGSV